MKENIREKIYTVVKYLIPIVLSVILVWIFTSNAVQLEMSLLGAWVSGIFGGFGLTFLGGLIIFVYLMNKGE